MRPGSVPFPCRPHKSPRWRPCFPRYVKSPPGWTGGCLRAEVSVSICLPKFVPTSKGLYSLDRKPWSFWLARAARLSEILFFRDEIPSSRRPFYGSGGGSCALEVLSSSQDGLYLSVSPAGLSVDQDAGGCERRSCSMYPSSAQDSSEAWGCWRVGWVVVDWFDAGEFRWCSSCSEAVVDFFPLLASLARRGRAARVRLPFPLPPEALATLEEKVKEPERSRPDGTSLPLRVGGCLAPHWRRWQAKERSPGS